MLDAARAEAPQTLEAALSMNLPNPSCDIAPTASDPERPAVPMTYRYSADIIIGEDGDYRISFPDLPRCEQAGATLDEAIANGKAVLIAGLECCRLRGLPLPLPSARPGACGASFIELTAAEMSLIRAMPPVGRTLLH